MYRCREKSVRYNEWSVKSAYVVGAYAFEYPQIADVFAYCFRYYGPAIAQQVAEKLQKMLETTLQSFVKDKVVDEVKSYLLDKLKEAVGMPSAPPPVAIAKKVIDAVVEVAGHLYIQTAVQNHKAIKSYWCTEYNPKNDLDQYVYFVLYSWVIDPEHGPYYPTILPGSKPL